jgi:hypothetical protein
MNEDTETKRLPADTCIFCDKKIDEIGGRRIVAQKLRGIELSSKYRGGGNPEYPDQSIRLYDNKEIYVVVWGENSKWTLSTTNKVKEEYLKGRQPWFCQVCGKRKCIECGAPINVPMGSDVLSDNGYISHVPMHPVDPGCINPKCKKYRD